MLVQSQHVFIASKPKSLWWYLYFWLSSRQMLWKMLRIIHWRSPFTQSYHWNHPEISVTSVTSSPRLWNTTISGNFGSYDDIVCRSFPYRWLPSNNVSHRLDRVCTTLLWLSFETLSSLNNTNCVNYIHFIIDINTQLVFRIITDFQTSGKILVVMNRIYDCSVSSNVHWSWVCLWIFMHASIASALSS